MLTLKYGDLPGMIGRELGCSDWFALTQARIDAFADLTDDHQWIHVDVERARREAGGTIAHGFLTLAMLSALAGQVFQIEDASRVLNYGFNRIRFISAVPAGGRIRLNQRLAGVEAKMDGLLLTADCTVEIEGQERPALAAEWLSLCFPKE